MKNYFKDEKVYITNKARRELVINISNIILAKRDMLPEVKLRDILVNGKRGKFEVRVFNYMRDKFTTFTGYYDTITSNSQVLERINDSLPRTLKGKMVAVIAGLDTEHFNKNKWHTFEL